MMGMSALVLDTAEAELDAAVERANQWVDTARPIIKSMNIIGDTGDYPILNMLVHDTRPRVGKNQTSRQRYNENTWREARGYVTKAIDSLYEMLDGIRSDFIADENRVWSKGQTEAEQDAADAFNEALPDRVITVAAALTMIEAERLAA